MRFFLAHRPLVAAVSAVAVGGRVAAPIGVQLANSLAQGQRYASVKAQGAYRKKSKRGIPKKLGAKRTGGTSETWGIHFFC
jgi:large subunit ribosomal protein L27